jgi:predicted short-subunit dehydrogenase-like oxidoreductase (DUF2520 family)
LLRRYPLLHTRRLVHCAGALSLPGVAGAHPLMTFSADRLYGLEDYRRIPFLVEEGHRFGKILPGLPNPHHTMPVGDKALYHALCVMAGNFPQLLWQEVAERFGQRLDLPPEMLAPYLRQVLENFLRDPAGALTGPLARGDAHTVDRNLQALADHPLEGLYRAFAEFHAARSAGNEAAARREAGS